MTENRAPYKTEADEAMEMLGKGYNRDDVPLEIVPQHSVIQRKGWEMHEVVIPAFVKISTSFKAELKEIDPVALKVWVFIALSINRNTEEAHPGIATLADMCGMGENTVIKAIRHLEARGLLAVHRANRKVNIYRIPDFVSANSKTTSKMEGDDETASENNETASQKRKTASAYERSNQINQSNNIKTDTAKPDFVNLTVSEAALLPEIRTYRDATGRIPGQGQWETVWQIVRELNGSGTAEALRPYYLEWCKRNYNPGGLGWLDWVQAGKIPEREKRTGRKQQDTFLERLAKA